MTRRFLSRWCAAALIAACLSKGGLAQGRALTWPELRDRFEATNPVLHAGQFNIDESKTQEVTAFLRPNPDISAALDQIQPFTPNPYRPLTALITLGTASYLHERGDKRELRLASAQKATAVAESQQQDLERNLLFNLRNAFVQILQAKAVNSLAVENLQYYDQFLGVSRSRLNAGDIAQVDLDRLELQRIQFETDLQSATVNLRTAKIQLLMMLNDRTPVEQFDVAGTFDFNDEVQALQELHTVAIASRPDLKAAIQSVDKARTDYKLAVANGSVDPTFGVDLARNPPFTAYVGFNVSIPLRIFDRNQGEKTRTELDIHRNELLQDAAQAQVFSDVDSAYATLTSSLTLLRSYKTTYLQMAARIRDTESFAYQRGGASLLDFIQAQNDYRSVQLNYLNLIGSYMTAASQLNFAVGSEVLP